MWGDDSQRKALRLEIGHRLRERRHAQGLSQEAVGAQAGIRQGVVSAMERGGNISVDNLVVMSRALGCSIDYLVSGASASSRAAA